MKDRLMKLRKEMKKKKPKFRRQEWFRKKKALGKKWRKPRGINSKLRQQIKSRGRVPKPGYGSPSAVRGLDKNGYREVLVRRPEDLEKINAEKEIAIIASGVGKKKKFEIMEMALEKKIKVGNYKIV